MKRINVAVIGVGFIGPAHVEALRRSGCTVMGVLDATPELSRRAAKQIGIPKAYNSLDELLDDVSIDSVHIASPNRLHYKQTRRALEAGKHVVREKPLAMTSKESARSSP